MIIWLKNLFAGKAQAPREDSTDRDISDDEIDPFNPFPAPVHLGITDAFDLHSIPPRDIQRAVEAYLQEARSRGYRRVRLIHGKGKGVQRAAVRRVLDRIPYVLAWSDAPPHAGGWGATIALLAAEDDGQIQTPREL